MTTYGKHWGKTMIFYILNQFPSKMSFSLSNEMFLSTLKTLSDMKGLALCVLLIC